MLPLMLSTGERCHLLPQRQKDKEYAIKLILYRRLYKDLHGKRDRNEKQMKGNNCIWKTSWAESCERLRGY